MRSNLQFLRRFYDLLLSLYPKGYWEEYGSELQTVFDLSLNEAASSSGFEAGRLILRELISLPKAVIHEHLRERRKTKMIGKFSSRFDFASGSFLEFFSASYPFILLGGVLPLMNVLMSLEILTPQSVLVNGIAIVLLAILGILCLIGLAKGLPRWSLPYLGMLLAIASLLLFNILVNFRLDVWWHRSSGFGNDFNFGNFLWIGLILLVFLLLAISRSVPRFRPFYQRLRDDWTLLSFLLYGMVPLMIWLSFDGYVNEEPFAILSLFMLALGGWFYLKNDEPLKRSVSLQIGLALSMLTATVGKAVLFMGSWFQVFNSTWKDELVPTVMTWIWLALIMLLPLLLNLFPQTESRPKVA